MRALEISIFFLFISLLSFGQQEIIFNGGESSVTFLNPLELDSTEKGKAHLLTSQSNGVKLFLDEKENFIYTPELTFVDASSYDSVKVSFANDSMFSLVARPVILIGLKAGDHELSYSFYKNGAALKLKNNSNSVEFKAIKTTPVFKNDAIVIGLLILVLALVFYTSGLKQFKKFYTIVPSLLLCYFIPAILNTLGIISGDYSSTYFVASRYLLPASLILLCLSIDLKEIKKLGSKAVIMFLAGTVGIIIGGPIALFIVASIAPGALGADAGELWRGLATVAGSWIGGGANQAAMKEIYITPNDIFSKMLLVDIIVANIWMAVLLYGIGKAKKIDKFFKADTTAIDRLREKMENFTASISKIPSTTDVMVILGIGLGGTALAHFGSELVTPFFKSISGWLETYKLTSLKSGFFWFIVFATIIGVCLSFTKLKSYEGAGASKIGSVFLYILVATIGTHMDIAAVAEAPILFLVGFIWMIIHAIILLGVAKIIKAPFFFIAVGSQANVGGAASAPVVAGEFSPSLAPVGVLLAVLGYAVGTFGALLCAEMMRYIPVG
jgi:uncharacterized membrane protein